MDIKKYFIQLNKDSKPPSNDSPSVDVHLDHYDNQPTDKDQRHDPSRPSPLDGNDKDHSGIDEDSLRSEITATSLASSDRSANDLPVPVSETHKRELLNKGPTQPSNLVFPKRKFSNGWLTFKPAWYNLKEAQGWLEYSVQSDKMYCFLCRLFVTEQVEKSESNWISIGVCNWKKGVEKIKKHFKSSQHKSAENAHVHYLQTSRHIDVMLDKNREEVLTKRQQEVENNRCYLSRLVDVARTLAKCGLPFRGHNEKNNSVNKGNFREIVTLLSHWDGAFAEYMENGARNCTYLSNRAQNDLIFAMGENVLSKITEDVKAAHFFSVMMDETTDVSGNEQVSIMVRFVDNQENIQEHLIGFSAVERANAETLFKLLKDTLISHDLNLSNIIGQCYDGASTMMGRYSGVQARVKDEVPHAIIVHCYGHCLNLVLVDTVKNNRTTKNFFGTLESLYCFICLSNCRNALFQKLQQEFHMSETANEDETDDFDTSLTIKKLCDTRWVCRYESIRAIEANLPIVINLLSFVIEDRSSLAKAVSDARGLIHQIRSFEFILAMVILKPLFEHTNIVTKYLQSIQIAAVSSVNATLPVIKRHRNGDKFKEYFEVATSLAHKFDIEIPMLHFMRKRSISHRLDDLWQNEHQHETIESKYRVEFYFEVLDRMVEEIERRFSQETQTLLISFSYLQPQKLQQRVEYQQCQESLTYLGQYYKLDVLALTTQYALFKEESFVQSCTSGLAVLQSIRQSGLHRVYCELYKLYSLVRELLAN